MNNTISDKIKVANLPYVPIPLARTTDDVMLDLNVMAIIVIISMSVSLRSVTVHLTLDVTTRWDHILVNVIVDSLVMAKLVVTLTNVPK